jgi:adenylate cyclase
MAGRIRLWSSYVLFFYVVTHLLNHALGLISLRVLEAGRTWFVFIWHNPLGQTVLYGALLVHFCLALWSLYQRRTLRLSRWEWTQWILGVLIVPLGTIHVVGTRVAHELYNVDPGYPWVLGSLLVSNWTGIVRQFSLPLVVWLHACIGLHFAWRLRPWYRAWLPALYAFALLVPIAGIGGAGIALRDVAELAQRPGFLEELFVRVRVPTADQIATLYAIADALQFTALGLLAIMLLARPARTLWERRAGVVHLSYGERRTASHATGLTVLEMSRIAGIPHASVCGGRGRCSTCRVRIGGEDRAKLPPASAEEQKVLSRVGAPDNVRLACQLRPPPGRYRVTPLLPASAGPVEAYRRQPQAHGGEHYVAILFADIRGFTSISEGKLPYDVVFILNRYFRATGHAIEAHGACPRRSQRGPVGRPRHATAHRDRPACRTGHRRRNGLRTRGPDHGDRRYRQYGQPSRVLDQGIRRRTSRISGTAGQRRLGSGNGPPPRRRDPGTPGPAGRARLQERCRSHGNVIRISLPRAAAGQESVASGGTPCARP